MSGGHTRAPDIEIAAARKRHSEGQVCRMYGVTGREVRGAVERVAEAVRRHRQIKGRDRRAREKARAEAVYPMPPHLVSALRDNGFTMDDIRSPSKPADLVGARQALAAFLRWHPSYQLSYQKIGAAVSRDHVTVMHACDVAAAGIGNPMGANKFRSLNAIWSVLHAAELEHAIAERLAEPLPIATQRPGAADGSMQSGDGVTHA